MLKPDINSLTGKIILALSSIALLTVLSGYTQPPQTDEGTGAHIFQLSIVLLVPALMIFLATADWTQPWRSARPLVFSGVVLVFAFGALYYLEHYHWRPNKTLSFSLSRGLCSGARLAGTRLR